VELAAPFVDDSALAWWTCRQRRSSAQAAAENKPAFATPRNDTPPVCTATGTTNSSGQVSASLVAGTTAGLVAIRQRDLRRDHHHRFRRQSCHRGATISAADHPLPMDVAPLEPRALSPHPRRIRAGRMPSSHDTAARAMPSHHHHHHHRRRAGEEGFVVPNGSGVRFRRLERGMGCRHHHLAGDPRALHGPAMDSFTAFLPPFQGLETTLISHRDAIARRGAPEQQDPSSQMCPPPRSPACAAVTAGLSACSPRAHKHSSGQTYSPGEPALCGEVRALIAGQR